ncbi:MAG: hypothetical protein R2911_19945 [Caldilineaceae bacterium]
MDAIRHGVYDTGLPPRPSPWKPGDDPNLLCKIECPQFASHGVRTLINYPALGAWAAEVTGRRPCRSAGFSCFGWAVGSVTPFPDQCGHPSGLDLLAAHVRRRQRTFTAWWCSAT